MEQKYKVGIVVVAYKNPTMTIRYIHEELPKIKQDIHIVVVNVASTKKDSLVLAESCGLCFADRGLSHVGEYKEKNKFLIWEPDNLGYAKGNNLGVEFLKQTGVSCDYILFSNDDIEIKSEKILEVLIDKAEKDNRIAAIGPRIVCIDGAEGSPQREYFSPWHIIGEYFLKSIRGHRQMTADGSPNPIAPPEGKAYWISGSFMLVKTEWFEKVGRFDERTFLYYEEPILAERFKKKGGYFYYTPEVSVLHYEGGSTKKSDMKQSIVEASRILYYKEYMNVNEMTLLLYKTFCWLKRIVHKIGKYLRLLE